MLEKRISMQSNVRLIGRLLKQRFGHVKFYFQAKK